MPPTNDKPKPVRTASARSVKGDRRNTAAVSNGAETFRQIDEIIKANTQQPRKRAPRIKGLQEGQKPAAPKTPREPPSVLQLPLSNDPQSGALTRIVQNELPREDEPSQALVQFHGQPPQQAGELELQSAPPMEMNPQLVAYLDRALSSAKASAIKDFIAMTQRVGNAMGAQWVQAINEAGLEKGQEWTQAIEQEGLKQGHQWSLDVQRAGLKAKEQWALAIQEEGIRQGNDWALTIQETALKASDDWALTLHQEGLKQGNKWVRAIHEAGLKAGERWAQAIHREGLKRGEDWALTVQRTGQAQGESWALAIQRAGQERGEEWTEAIQHAGERLGDAFVQETKKMVSEQVDELSQLMQSLNVTGRRNVQYVNDTGEKNVTMIERRANEIGGKLKSKKPPEQLNSNIGSRPKEVVMPPNGKDTVMTDASGSTNFDAILKRLNALEDENRALRDQVRELTHQNTAIRDSRVPRDPPSVAYSSNTSAPLVRSSPLDEFTLDKRVKLNVPPEREKEALRIAGVEKGSSTYGGDWIFMNAGRNLVPAEEFWTPRIKLQYDKSSGRDTFSRQNWTILDVSPHHESNWRRAEKLPGVIAIDTDDGRHLAVPPDTDLMPVKEFWSDRTKEHFVTKDDERDVLGKWARLHVSPEDRSNWERAKAIQGVREFADEDGKRVLAIPGDHDLTSAKKADFYFSRREWTKLEVPAEDADTVKAIHGVIELSQDKGGHLTIPPGNNLLAVKEWWPQVARDDYNVRHNEKFTREGWTILKVKPGSREFGDALTIPGVRAFGPRKDQLGIPKGKDLLPAEQYWPGAVRDEYNRHRANILSVQRAKEERSRSVR